MVKQQQQGEPRREQEKKRAEEKKQTAISSSQEVAAKKGRKAGRWKQTMNCKGAEEETAGERRNKWNLRWGTDWSRTLSFFPSPPNLDKREKKDQEEGKKKGGGEGRK